MTSCENISVFGGGAVTYNPQMKKKKNPRLMTNAGTTRQMLVSNGKPYKAKEKSTHSFPMTSLFFSNEDNANKIHPTQKPVALLEYLTLTYTNPGDTILDCTMGSCPTGKAAIKNGRSFIGIDNGYCEKKDSEYYGWSWVDYAHVALANIAGEFVRTPAEKATGQMSLLLEAG
jgi:site-specific DNA-methyltransferase (adenine-specific)